MCEKEDGRIGPAEIVEDETLEAASLAGRKPDAVSPVRVVGCVTPREVQRIVNDWTTRARPSTVRRQYDVLRAVFAAAVEVDIIARTPCRGVRLPARVQRSPRIPSPEELDKLATEIGEQWSAMVWSAALLGLRWGECAGLRVGRIDFELERVNIVEQVTRGSHGIMVAEPPKSEAGIRRLAAPRSLLELLAAHIRRLQAPRPETLLFSELDGDLRAMKLR
jgi:integrase